MSETLVTKLVEATHEVFETMVFRTLAQGDPVPDAQGAPKSNVVGTVGFAGSASGLVAFYSTLDAAKEITGAMLGMEVNELGEDVKDAIGEITNMVAGGLKVSLTECGRRIELAIPTTAIGKSIRTSGLSGASLARVPFATPQGRFWVELRYILS